MPDGGEIGSKCKQAIALVFGEHAWTCAFAVCKFGFGGFECAQALFPLALEAAGDQPVIWIDGTIASLRTASFGAILGSVQLCIVAMLLLIIAVNTNA